VNIRWSGAIRGRAGIAADNLLFYVAGGLAAARGELAITDLAALPVTTADDVLLGWTLGGGVEMTFDENWVARLDYRYSDYGSLDYVVDGIDHGSMAVTTHALTLGVAYRF
jgi:outer membrane immunogenic protein